MYKVTAFLQGSPHMHSLNPIFVLSTASCLSSLKANLSAYSLGSNFPPFLSASLQELFPFASAFTLYLPFGINSIFLFSENTLSAPASLKLLPILLFFRKVLKRVLHMYFNFLPFTSTLSAILLLFPFKGYNVIS